MSDPVIDGIGATTPGHYGAPGTGVVLAPATIATAWNVQGDPANAGFTEQGRTLFGAPLPLVPNTTTRSAASTILWLGPRSWLVLQGSASAPAAFDAQRDALMAHGGALFDVTASRVAFTLRGPHAAIVLAAQCPLDFDPRVFPPMHCAQSLVGHINALICRHADVQVFSVLVARSMAADAWHGLCVAAASAGYDVAPASALSIG